MPMIDEVQNHPFLQILRFRIPVDVALHSFVWWKAILGPPQVQNLPRDYLPKPGPESVVRTDPFQSNSGAGFWAAWWNAQG